jgi:hypothetical protein
MAHSAFAYLLAHQSFEDFVAATIYYPGALEDPLKFRHDPAILGTFLAHAWQSLLNLVPVVFLGLGAMGWILSAWFRPDYRNALWGLCLVPLSILPVSAFLLGPYYPIHSYMVFLALPVLAGIAMLAGIAWPIRSATTSLALCAIVALGLAVVDSWRWRGRFEVNPPASVWWTSDPETKRLVSAARERVGRPLVLAASCDVITLLIDVPAEISRLVIFSDDGAISHSTAYLRDCTSLYFRKRSGDVLLPGEADALSAARPDAIYTTRAGLEWLRGVDLGQFESHELRDGRVLLLRTPS